MHYMIADLKLNMTPTGRTKQQAEPYRTAFDGPADINIELDVSRFMEKNPQLTDPDMAEYLATGVLFARRVLDFDGCYIHSSAVILDGRAYLFSAPSGTGKSTHTEKWCRLFGARYLNDDKPVLRLVDGQWMAYGTPWSGKHDLSSNEGAPLGGIVYLRRGQENTIRRLSVEEAVPRIMSQSPYYLTQEQTEKKLALLNKLLLQVPVWELYCRNDDDAAYVSHTALTGQDCVQERS